MSDGQQPLALLVASLREQREQLLLSYAALSQPVPVSHVLAVNASACVMERAAASLDAIARVLRSLDEKGDGAAVRALRSAAQAVPSDDPRVASVVEHSPDAKTAEQQPEDGRGACE